MVVSLTCLAISKIPQAGEMAGPVKSLLCRQENLISQAPKKKSRGVAHTCSPLLGKQRQEHP